ncbi:MAG: hypothetical protein H7288_15615 [Kineosporiaceae bacterium]|nr:hypothetical protein [Aeromicrobium sp.]
MTARSWLIVTRDRQIQNNRAEIDAVRNAGARMVTISGREGTTKWAQLEIFMSQWRKIEALIGESGPFIYTATRSTLSSVSL